MWFSALFLQKMLGVEKHLTAGVWVSTAETQRDCGVDLPFT